MDTTPRIDPHLERHRQAIGAALELDDPTEVDAALEDIQTLLVRCGYHLEHQRFAQQLKRKRRSIRPDRPAGSAPLPRRGRPKGSANWAERQLGLGLAEIWRTHAGRTPTRRIYWGNGLGYGPYHDFVKLIHPLLPRPVQRTWRGHAVSVDYLVQIAVAEFKAAADSSSEARHRGLIEQHRWDGTTSQT